MGNIARLSALIGSARVIEMIFAARLLSAGEALAAGLVGQVLPDAFGLYARATELAALVASHAPLTLRATKETVRRLRDSLPPDEDLIQLCYASADFREGMEAFLSKRAAVWSGA
jgi:enoyl-CoA hydratase